MERNYLIHNSFKFLQWSSQLTSFTVICVFACVCRCASSVSARVEARGPLQVSSLITLHLWNCNFDLCMWRPEADAAVNYSIIPHLTFWKQGLSLNNTHWLARMAGQSALGSTTRVVDGCGCWGAKLGPSCVSRKAPCWLSHVSSSYLILWDQISSWTWCPPFLRGLLDSEPPGFSCFYPPSAGLKVHAAMPGFYVGTGQSEPHVCTRKHFTH